MQDNDRTGERCPSCSAPESWVPGYRYRKENGGVAYTAARQIRHTTDCSVLQDAIAAAMDACVSYRDRLATL